MKLINKLAGLSLMNSTAVTTKTSANEFQNVELIGIDRFYGRFLAGELTADEFSNVLDLHIQFSNH